MSTKKPVTFREAASDVTVAVTSSEPGTVSVAGTVTVLSQVYRVGKKRLGLYLRLVVDTGQGRLTAYLNGRVLQRWPYKLLND